MITKKFFIEDFPLIYYVGINQILFDYNYYLKENNLNTQRDALEFLFTLSNQISQNFEDATIQFIDDALVLNYEHIFKSVYYVQRAFFYKINISNSKAMELLLYLSTKRQIKKSIEAFGVKPSKLKQGKLTYCVISPENNLANINQEILQKLNAKEFEPTLNSASKEKIFNIKTYYDFNNDQIKSIIESYDLPDFSTDREEIESSLLALQDLLYERMALLSLEKIKTD